ncbi:hypothetical protein D029_4785B, partial [Vibrio parahaemolyticus 970107]
SELLCGLSQISYIEKWGYH